MPVLTFWAATTSIGISETPEIVQEVYTSINLCRTRGQNSVNETGQDDVIQSDILQ